jgi:hypothetical protein
VSDGRVIAEDEIEEVVVPYVKTYTFRLRLKSLLT